MIAAPLPQLTSLRFFAAGAIVLFHMSGQGLMPFAAQPALANGVSFFFVLSGFILAYNYDGDWSWHQVILHLPPMRLFEFLTGMAVARFFARHRFGGDLQEVAAVAAVIVSVVGMNWLKQPGPFGVWMSQSGSFLAFAFLIYTFASGKGFVSRALQHPDLVLLGEISFATYMVHQIVIGHAVRSKLTVLWSTPVAAATVILVSYLASYALWKLVEKPAQRWITRRPGREDQQPAPRQQVPIRGAARS